MKDESGNGTTTVIVGVKHGKKAKADSSSQGSSE
jgi:hypothetical protein